MDTSDWELKKRAKQGRQRSWGDSPRHLGDSPDLGMNRPIGWGDSPQGSESLWAGPRIVPFT